MFEKYNEKARRALFFARYEASKLGSKVIESEHLLLGILREGEDIIKEIFGRFNVKPEDVRREIEGDRIFVERISSTAELPLSEESKKILAYASHEAESMMHPYVGTEHLLIGLLRVDGCVAGRLLTARGFNLYGVREETISLIKEREVSKQKKELPFLAEYSRDLTQLAGTGTFDPLIGRDKEVERIIQILSRRTKNNPILLGEPGVGKTAIVEGLATRIVEGAVPIFLASKKILALDLSLIVAGTKYRGQFEERLKGIIRELRGEPGPHHLHRRDPLPDRRRIGRGLARRGQHPEAGPLARRGLLRRRDDAQGVPQVHREGPQPAAALPGDPRDRALGERDLRDPRGGQGPLRAVPQGALLGRGDQDRGLPVQPLHHGPVLPGQGHRHPRRGRARR